MPPKFVPGQQAALAETLREVQQSLDEVTRTLRNYRRRSRRADKMPKGLHTSATILFCRTKGDRAVLEQFLAQQKGNPLETLHGWSERIQSEYDKMDEEQKAAWEAVQPADPGHGQAARAVQRFLSDAALHSWVHHQNTQNSIAPCTGVLLQHMASQPLPEPSASSASSSRKYRSTLQFLRRWRHRWHVTQGKVQPHDATGPVELQQKVKSAPRPASSKQRRRNFLAPGERQHQNGVHYMAAVLVPPIETQRGWVPENGTFFFSVAGRWLFFRSLLLGGGATFCTGRSRKAKPSYVATSTKRPSGCSRTRVVGAGPKHHGSSGAPPAACLGQSAGESSARPSLMWVSCAIAKKFSSISRRFWSSAKMQ